MNISKRFFIIILTVLFVFSAMSMASDSDFECLEERIKFDREIVQRIANGEDILYDEDGITILFLWENDGEISPHWGSQGSAKVHQWMVSRALAVLENDFGYWVTDPFYAGGHIGQMMAGADWPDIWETDGLSFAGHFYNPTTGRNYMGQTSPTAKIRFEQWSDQARNHWNSNRALALHYLGCSLHYLSDLSAPHHVHNHTALDSDHTAFEDWADANRNNYRLINGNQYHIGGSWNVMRANIANGCAYATYYDSTFILDQSHPDRDVYRLLNWGSTANNTLKHGQNYMAAFLYRFLQTVGEI
ncbi:hypothetical protein [Desulfitibacter alkalitolerans]|uniref:hypothetical protein n=1 Tax=Desulfitibacter alkalitolerans TaxID=264641 RepID=UPI000686188A|nr:hypothetical protein [Desulfitibacter alkalitolerans]